MEHFFQIQNNFIVKFEQLFQYDKKYIPFQQQVIRKDYFRHFSPQVALLMDCVEMSLID